MISEIWSSFRRLPGWVQIWAVLILIPVNMAAVLFLGQPYATLIAGLAIGGMLPNLAIMGAERGLSKAMALPHLLFWIPLVVVIVSLLWGKTELGPDYRSFLWALLAINLVSLAFDIPDAWKWWCGDRGIA